MARIKPLNKQELDALRDQLGGLQPQNVYGPEQVVKELYEIIAAKLDAGCTDAQVIDALKKGGVELKESSFKTYLRKAKADRKPKTEGSTNPTTQTK